MSETAFQNLLASLPVPRDAAARKSIQAQKRLLNLLRYFDEKRETRQVREYSRRDSPILDALYPERSQSWLPRSARKEQRVVKLSDFSFLDNPRRTLELIREIAICEASALRYSIDFNDEACLDIGPYMVLALMRETMCENLTGGKIKDGIGAVLKAARLDRLFRIRPERSGDKVPVLPFPIVRRRPSGTSTADNRSAFVSTEEDTAASFAETVDRWLDMQSPRQRLTDFGRNQVISIIGEVLDNAKRHSDAVAWDGSWAIAGFLEAREREDGSVTLACHLGIVSLGLSVYQSLQHAPEEMKAKVEEYAHSYRSLFGGRAFDEEALWTAAALQDGVSRVPSLEGSPGGFGMMELVQMMNALNHSTNPAGKPSLTLVSGSSCVMVRDQYSLFTTAERGHRVIAFNEANNLANPPDEAYVFCLPYRFPGTVVAMRFFFDPQATVGNAS
jgi:hypothetical protein